MVDSANGGASASVQLTARLVVASAGRDRSG